MCSVACGILGEENVSESRERKSSIYKITIRREHYAQILKITFLLLQKLDRLRGENKNMHKKRKKITKIESDIY